MIGLLSGTIASVEASIALLEVSGVGYEVHMPAGDLASLHAGSSARVYTTMNVSQDAITLFGFLSKSSKMLFIRLQKVSGIGPKVALSLLSTLRPDQLIAAIEAGDATALSKAPGLGRKGAQKIILDLAGRLDLPERNTTDRDNNLDSGSQQVVQGLISLGWQARDAERAVQQVSQEGNFTVPLSPEDVPQVLKLALTSLDRGR
ncbi:MAG: Holliday junction branch migration protein RuvA [Bifidobacterium sp.]|jgi:Holliday junction DNA helicase RuvA|nr:Holliday junction branch migration protein RuvA [Bifidobacterium sp.]MCH4174331.1 Holliday junction branch migration protein RuvA [Bifidobacterium sp.]